MSNSMNHWQLSLAMLFVATLILVTDAPWYQAGTTSLSWSLLKSDDFTRINIWDTSPSWCGCWRRNVLVTTIIYEWSFRPFLSPTSTIFLHTLRAPTFKRCHQHSQIVTNFSQTKHTKSLYKIGFWSVCKNVQFKINLYSLSEVHILK